MPVIALFFEPAPLIRPVSLQIVRLTVGHLFRSGLKVWPFATTLEEAEEVLAVLRKKEQEPSLFVVNTFQAESALPQLDKLMGETPVVLFRRELAWLQKNTGLQEASDLTIAIQNMTPRLTSIWRYGKTNAPEIASRAAQRIGQYLHSGDFSALERQMPAGTGRST